MHTGTVTPVMFACATRPWRLVKGERAERSRGPRSSGRPVGVRVVRLQGYRGRSARRRLRGARGDVQGHDRLQSEPVSRRGLAECLLGNGTRNHVLCKLTPSRRRVLRINWRKSRFRITVTIARPETGQLAGHPCPTAGPRCSSRWRAFLSPVHNFTDPRCCRKATAPSRVRGRVSCNSRD